MMGIHIEEAAVIYRTVAGEQVSQLGFGMMRLPTADGKIDQRKVNQMVSSAIDRGLNYLDTAYVYHGGLSEASLAEALAGGRREQVMIADKCPVWLVESPADFPRLLDEQLERLKTDHIDFYLLHALNQGTWDKCLKHGAIEFCEKAKAQGKIRHFGFSFHDETPVFLPILKHYPWEFCQVQYNYLDRQYQACESGLEAAAAQGTSVVVMEPLRGGNLAGPVPRTVQDLWDRAPKRRTAAEWALRWVWNHPDVGVVLSGMGTQEQVDENLATAATARAGALTPEELTLVDQAEKAYRSLIQVGCTACRYCMPCPHGVDIPANFTAYNSYHMFDRSPGARGAYQWIAAGARADQCVRCGACTPQCPQGIAIPEVLAQVAQTLG